jgi:hypothetical protein
MRNHEFTWISTLLQLDFPAVIAFAYFPDINVCPILAARFATMNIYRGVVADKMQRQKPKVAASAMNGL